MLSMDEAPPLSSEDFVALCEEHLTDGDHRIVTSVMNMDTEDGNSLVQTLRLQEIDLSNAIVRIRASQLHLDAAEYLHGDNRDLAAERAVGEAYSLSDPHAREQALDKYRWSQLDDLAGFDPFSIRALVIYGRKIRIAERWEAMDKEEGNQRVQTMISEESETATEETDAA